MTDDEGPQGHTGEPQYGNGALLPPHEQDRLAPPTIELPSKDEDRMHESPANMGAKDMPHACDRNDEVME